MKTSRLSLISFGLLTAVTVSLAVISVGSHAGWPVAIYTSWPMVTLWSLAAVASLALMLRRHIYKRPVVAALHLALIVILAGALLTHLTAEEERLHLRVNGGSVTATDDLSLRLPSAISLDSFRVDTYPGTGTPRDFVACISDAAGRSSVVSMNSPGHLAGYTFISESYDSDGGGITFSISRDPWGIGVTYAGYFMLGVSMLLYFFRRDSEWRRAVRKLSAAALMVLPLTGIAAETSAIAGELGLVTVYYNGRLCPMSALARDFTAGLTGGASSYRGQSADEVLAGFLFDFSRWKREEILRVDDSELRRILKCDGKHASYEAFFNAVASGRINLEDEASRRKYSKEIDRFEAVNMLVSGELLKIFPVEEAGEAIRWLGPTDRLPVEIDNERWLFIRKFLGLLNEQVQRGDRSMQKSLLEGLSRYQKKVTGDATPSRDRLEMERVYIAVASARWPWMAVTATGLILFVLTASGFGRPRCLRLAGVSVAGILLCGATAMTALRWIISGHVPMSNGYETMQFLAWILLLAAVLCRRIGILVPMGILGAGLAMGVSVLGGAGSSVTGLMPVLDSKLLSVHVAMVMSAYALFFLMSLTGLLGLCKKQEAARLATLNRAMLYPALMLLAAGIFTGAVWANVSWGRYWGWDPKEVWALITMLVYSLAAHPGLIPWFENPRKFNFFSAIAFICVIITYFGVNFILGGLHSYA